MYSCIANFAQGNVLMCSRELYVLIQTFSLLISSPNNRWVLFKHLEIRYWSALVFATTLKRSSDEWDKWIDNWSRFPLNGFLRSTATEVRNKLDANYRCDINWVELGKLLPWPEEAITAYSVYNYTEQLDQCLVQFLRDELGEWWSDNMHHIRGGMSKLP